MKALVLQDDRKLVIENRSFPARITDDDVLVRISACGVCGSDIPRGFRGKAYHYPLVMGHELSGRIADVPSGSTFSIGDEVAVFPLLSCKKCAACQTGEYAQCIDYNYFGSRCDGGFEEYLYVPPANLISIPPHVELFHAAMTEPAAVALHGVRKLHIQAGDTGVVFGAGPIGNMTAQWLRIHGCSRVIVIDTDPEKLAVAARMNFETLNNSDDAVKGVMQLTNGKGAERVVEAVGVPVTFLQAIQVASTFGEVVFMGNLQGTFSIEEKDFSGILRKELSIYGTWNSKITPTGTDDWTTVLKYMDKELDVGSLITDTPRLDQGQEIFESIIGKKKSHNKVIFNIDA